MHFRALETSTTKFQIFAVSFKVETFHIIKTIRETFLLPKTISKQTMLLHIRAR